ncbi:hypothetical protein IFR05_012957 [Cadophora sp. M221]|nr:hypothetical protein IFR05_012957 [Cadophora sp. M221]
MEDIDARTEPGSKCVTLVSDIWYMVFNEIHLWVLHSILHVDNDEEYLEQPQEWLRSLRLVSKTFNEIITPLAYWEVGISSIGPFQALPDVQGAATDHFQHCMCQYTRKIEVYSIKKQFPLDKLAAIAESSQVLEFFRWDHEIPDGFVGVAQRSLAMSLLCNAFLHGQKAQISYSFVEEFFWGTEIPNGAPEKESAWATYRTIYDSSHELERLELFVNVLATLCIAGDGTLTTGLVPTGRKYPPMQKFVLEEVNWAYKVEEINQMWDFSNLRCLSIFHSGCQEFCLNIPIQNFPHLRTVKFDYKLSEEKAPRSWITSLLRESRELSTLKIEQDSWQESVDIRELMTLGSRLRKLRLMNHVKNYSLEPISPSLLKGIMRVCPSIVDLTEDMPLSGEWSAREISDFLLEFAGARELKDSQSRPRNTEDDYYLFEDHLIRKFSSRKHKAGICCHDGEYEQWGRLRRKFCHRPSSYQSSSEDEDPWTEWSYFEEAATQTAAARADDRDDDRDGKDNDGGSINESPEEFQGPESEEELSDQEDVHTGGDAGADQSVCELDDVKLHDNLKNLLLSNGLEVERDGI